MPGAPHTAPDSSDYAMTIPVVSHIEHEPRQSRFIARVEGEQAVLEYGKQGGRLTITHTRVPAAIEGRGVAGALTRAALEYARAQHLKVVPECAYAAAFVQRHGEYADLVER